MIEYNELDMDLKIENIEEILCLLEKANHEYYNNDNSIISDFKFFHQL